MRRVKGIIAVVCAVFAIGFIVWLIGSRNPQTPAGYVGYLVQGSIFGKAKFYGIQTGPTSPGRTWLLRVVNVSVTPYTYTEEFTGGDSVLSYDNLKISFRVHIVWRVKSDMVREFVEKYSTLAKDETPDRVVQIAYNNSIREPLRKDARDEVQRLNGLEIKNNITPIGETLFTRIKALTETTPFLVTSIVVGNIQYPEQVATAVAEKMATTQVLERKQTEIEIEKAEKTKRIVQAEGIAKAMEIIQVKLTSQYLQHEAIEAQKLMVDSPNHTVLFVPTGAMGVPIAGTFDIMPEKASHQDITDKTKTNKPSTDK